jgi:hypothetical protein
VRVRRQQPGFAIGFNAKQMPAHPLRVLYDEGLQIRELLENRKHTYGHDKSIGFKFDDNFQSHLSNVGPELCEYKHSTYREEKKIRRGNLSGLASGEKSIKIMAIGARDHDDNALSEPIELFFRTS